MVFGLSLCLAWQGWKTADPGDDDVPSIEGATQILRAGVLPDRGDINSYGSLNPPGAAWLYVPGMLLFRDYRLFPLAGALLLHAGTLVGLFLLAKMAFGGSSALVAALFYAFSPVGLFFARSLWPVGHPFFTVWFVLCLILWQARRNPRYLAIALVFLAAGMYVYLEPAPLVLAAVATYLLYRSPVRSGWLIPAAAVVLAIWAPYLRFEWNRGFKDLVGQALQTDITPGDAGEAAYAQSSAAPGARPSGSGIAALRSVAAFIRSRPAAIATGTLGNFDLGRFPANGLSLAGRPVWLCIALAMFGLTAAATWARARRGRHASGGDASPGSAESGRIVSLALALPWVVFLALARQAAGRYYLFLWPLQAAFLADAVLSLLPQRVSKGFVRRAALWSLLAAYVGCGAMPSLTSWKAGGWSGADSDLRNALACLVNQVKEQKRDRVAIGYSGLFASTDTAFHAIDARYKNGFEADYILSQAFGVTNTDTSPEGLSPEDDYVLAAQSTGRLGAPQRETLPIETARFRLIAQLGSVAVFAKRGPHVP